jgi:DNA-binding MltR family transcriptional regulator
MKPIDATLVDYRLMLILFENESDRGAAVLAGSYVENHLGLYLRSRMKDPSVAEQMFSSEGPLSTFSQRIYLAQAIGFLSKEQCADLHLIKKIRNYFSHHPKEASFNDKPVSDWVDNLIATKTKIIMPDGTTGAIGEARFRYLISAGMFVALTMMDANGA